MDLLTVLMDVSVIHLGPPGLIINTVVDLEFD